MGLRASHPPPMQPPCFVYHGGRLTEQDGIACQTEDKIGPAPRGDHLHDLRSGKMRIPRESCHPFHTKVATDSTQNLPPPERAKCDAGHNPSVS